MDSSSDIASRVGQAKIAAAAYITERPAGIEANELTAVAIAACVSGADHRRHVSLEPPVGASAAL